MSKDVGLVSIRPLGDPPPDLGELMGPGWVRGDAGLTHAELGASLVVFQAPTGFSGFRVRVPSDRFIGSMAATATRVLRELLDASARLGCGLAYVSRYDHHLDSDWIEQNLLLPWLLEEVSDLVRPAWTAVFIGPALAGQLPRHPDWTELRARDDGYIYLIEEDLNPYAEGVVP